MIKPDVRKTITEIVNQYPKKEIEQKISRVSFREVEKSLSREHRTTEDLLALISTAADPYLEAMFQLAEEATKRHFGRGVDIYAPLYIADYCTNNCRYCGFRAENHKIERSRIELDEILANYQILSSYGIKSVLLLTGESRVKSSPEYIRDAVFAAGDFFSSISIEVYPLEEEEYKMLFEAGADGLALYQETYDQELYDFVHPSGKKKDFQYRIEAPERGIRNGMANVTIGALYGLGNFHFDAFMTGLHLHYLKLKYPFVNYSLSFPRMREASGLNFPVCPVNDRDFIKLVCAFRLVFPEITISISTREEGKMRDLLITSAVNKISAGSKTEVGGYTRPSKLDGQFLISDDRSVEETLRAVRNRGREPVMQNWINPHGKRVVS